VASADRDSARQAGLITIALGYCYASFTPNAWAILQATVEPHAVVGRGGS